MNKMKFTPVGSLSNTFEFEIGQIGLLTEYSYNDKPPQDSLVIACGTDEQTLSKFKNSKDAVCAILQKRNSSNKLHVYFADPSDDQNEWIYVPNEKLQLMINPESRQKNKYFPTSNSTTPIYLDKFGSSLLRTRFGTLNLTKHYITKNAVNFDEAMSVEEWAYFYSIKNTLECFWKMEKTQ